jgi:hypothetical protein
MHRRVDGRLAGELRTLYQANKVMGRFSDWAAGRSKDSSETSIDRLMHVAQVGRSEAVHLARALDEIGCGDFIIGRKGRKSRIRWAFSLRKLGQAARERAAPVEETDISVASGAADQQVPRGNEERSAGRALAIAKAKRGLAAAFGISPEAIDIVMRG